MATTTSNLFSRAKDLRARGEEFLWRERSGNEPLPLRFLLRTLQIAYAVARDLGSGQISLRAMGLVYYTVIASVPMLALTFSVLKGLGVHNTLEPTLLRVLEPFLGEYANDITSNVVGFVDNIRVDVLSFVSLGILLYTVLAMMQKMEAAFNYIWSVNQPRSLGNRISEYLFAVIVSPLLILISVGIASYVNTNFFVEHVEGLRFGSRILQFLGWVMPALFMSIAFAFAYSFIPNIRVKFTSAWVGGIVTTFAWMLMGWIFRNFITVESANAVIYAAFFVVILLMLFIYLGWFVMLVGSAVAFYHQYPSRTRIGRTRPQLSIAEQEEVTLTVAALIIRRFQQGDPPWAQTELIDHCNLNAQIVQTALDTLIDIGFIYQTSDEPRRFLPGASVHDMTILELRHRIREHSFDHMPNRAVSRDQLAVREFLNNSEQVLIEKLGDQRFRSLYQEADDASGEKQKK